MRKADNLPSSCAVVTKSGKLNFLETSGPVQAFNGTALPLLYLSHLALVRLLTAMSISVEWNTNVRGDGGKYVAPKYTTHCCK